MKVVCPPGVVFVLCFSHFFPVSSLFCCFFRSISLVFFFSGTQRISLPYRLGDFGAGASSMDSPPGDEENGEYLLLALHSLDWSVFSASGVYTYTSRRSMISATISAVRHPSAASSNFRRTYTLRTPP